MDLSSSAAALLAGDVPVQVRHFPLRGGEKLLELVLEGQIAGGGGVRCLNGGPPRDGGLLPDGAGSSAGRGAPVRATPF